MQNNLKEIQEFVREKCGLRCDYFEYCCEDNGGNHCQKCGLTNEEHHELNLTRVLNAHKGQNCLVWQDDALFFKYDNSGNIFQWKFLNEDSTECTFEQQEESVQLAIAKLLEYKPTNMAESVETN